LNRVWANGHEETEITVSVLNAQGQGVAGRKIGLSANPAGGVTITETSSGSAVTNSLGQAHFIAKSTKIGLVVFTATDVGNPALTATAQVEFIQRRVVVFVQGIIAELNDTTHTADTVFPEIRQLLSDTGFSRPPNGTRETGKQCANSLIDINHADDDGDGVSDDGCPLILVYSYKDGHVSKTTGLWFPNPYDCIDTSNKISASIHQLTSLLQEFTKQNPNTRFILIGHSQGGLLVLQGAWSMTGSVPIDAVITLDGALGGAPRVGVDLTSLTCWGDPAASDLIDLWNSACSKHDSATQCSNNHSHQGTTAIYHKQDNFSIVASLQAAGTKVFTIGSRDDCVWNPNKCHFSTNDNTSSQIVDNADNATLLDLGGNCNVNFNPSLSCISDSHSRVYKDSAVLNMIKTFIGSPTVP